MQTQPTDHSWKGLSNYSGGRSVERRAPRASMHTSPLFTKPGRNGTRRRQQRLALRLRQPAGTDVRLDLIDERLQLIARGRRVPGRCAAAPAEARRCRLQLDLQRSAFPRRERA